MSDPTDYYRSMPPLSVYDPSPEQARAAALYVASRCAAGAISLDDARTVLAALGLAPDRDAAVPAPRDSLGKLRPERRTA